MSKPDKVPSVLLNDGVLSDIAECNYLTAISKEFSVLFNKSNQELRVCHITEKKLYSKWSRCNNFEALCFVDDNTLIGFAEKKFYVMDMRMFGQGQFIVRDFPAYFEHVTSMGIDKLSETKQIFFLSSENHCVYRQNVETGDAPELICNGVEYMSVTNRGIVVSQIDGVRLIEVCGVQVSETLYIPILDVTCVTGGESCFTIRTQDGIHVFSEMGELRESIQYCDTISQQTNSNAFISSSDIFFVEPYTGQIKTHAVAAGFVGKMCFYWDLDYHCQTTLIPNPKINLVSKNSALPKVENHNNKPQKKNVDSEYRGQENRKKAMEQKKKKDDERKKNEEKKKRKEDERRKKDEEKRGNTGKYDKKANKVEEKPVEEVKEEFKKVESRTVLLIIHYGKNKFTPDLFQKYLPKGDTSKFAMPTALNIAFAACESTVDDNDLVQSLEKKIGDKTKVVLLPDDGSVDPFYVLAGPGQTIAAKDMKPILLLLGITATNYGSVFICKPKENEKEIYAKQFLSNLEVNGKKVLVFDSINDIPAVIVYDVDDKNPKKLENFMAPIKSPKLIIPQSHFVQFMDKSAVDEALKLDYTMFDKKTATVVRFTNPPMKENKNLNLSVEGFSQKETDKAMFDLLKPKFKELAHVWRQNDEFVNLFFYDEKHVKNAAKMISKGVKIGNTKIHF